MDPLFGFLFGLDACLFGLLGFVVSFFWLWMMVDALLNEPTPLEKILWFLVIFFLYVIGALIYYFVRYRQHHWK
jgi:hypothetical protein